MTKGNDNKIFLEWFELFKPLFLYCIPNIIGIKKCLHNEGCVVMIFFKKAIDLLNAIMIFGIKYYFADSIAAMLELFMKITFIVINEPFFRGPDNGKVNADHDYFFIVKFGYWGLL